MILGNFTFPRLAAARADGNIAGSPAYSFALRARTSSCTIGPYTVEIVLPWLVILDTVSICVVTPFGQRVIDQSLKQRVLRGKSGSHERAVMGSFRYS